MSEPTDILDVVVDSHSKGTDWKLGSGLNNQGFFSLKPFLRIANDRMELFMFMIEIEDNGEFYIHQYKMLDAQFLMIITMHCHILHVWLHCHSRGLERYRVLLLPRINLLIKKGVEKIQR